MSRCRALQHECHYLGRGRTNRIWRSTQTAHERSSFAAVAPKYYWNALKYRGPQPPEISIQSERNGSNWVIRIADNGIGIEPRYQQRIFEPFKRLHSNDEYPGTGIGLALCQKVVQRYNGRIWVNSELGQGYTFYFSVPDGTGRVSAV